MDISGFFTVTLPQALSAIELHPVMPLSFVMTVVMSACGTPLLMQATRRFDWVSPVPFFSILFLGAYFAHMLLGRIEIPGMSQLPQIMVITLFGMTLGTFALLATLRPKPN